MQWNEPKAFNEYSTKKYLEESNSWFSFFHFIYWLFLIGGIYLFYNIVKLETGREPFWFQAFTVVLILASLFFLPREKFQKRLKNDNYTIEIQENQIRRINNDVWSEDELLGSLLKTATRVKFSDIQKFQILNVEEFNIQLKLLQVTTLNNKNTYFGVCDSVDEDMLRKKLVSLMAT